MNSDSHRSQLLAAYEKLLRCHLEILFPSMNGIIHSIMAAIISEMEKTSVWKNAPPNPSFLSLKTLLPFLKHSVCGLHELGVVSRQHSQMPLSFTGLHEGHFVMFLDCVNW